jgi:hypothetical protein
MHVFESWLVSFLATALTREICQRKFGDIKGALLYHIVISLCSYLDAVATY